MPVNPSGSSGFSNGIVVLPTYNERENLCCIVEALWEQIPGIHILVVDDNSPDGTGDVADLLQRRYPDRFFVLHRQKKEGLGRAYVAAFRHLREHRYKFVVQMDADLSHAPSDLPAMIERLADNDVVVGSRYRNGRVINWSMPRLLLSKAANLYAKCVTQLPINDGTGGFTLWRKTALDEIDLDRVFSLGYVFQVEMKYRAYRSGMRLIEVPITFRERKHGGSKMNWSIAFEACVAILRLRYAATFRLSASAPERRPSASAATSGR